MMSFFLNPWTMAAGAALVSAPIIIHLINRMRFRRIQWAAMEFLLKAQKRMRRKMIIEQLILLFLRCLLIFLAGLLFARFLGFDPLQGKETRPTLHIIVLDDTPSMADTGRGDGPKGGPFDSARMQITDKIMPAALEATTTQQLRILRLSDQTDLLNADGVEKGPAQITSTLIDRVKVVLGNEKVSTVHVSLVKGLKKAKVLADQAGGDAETAKVVHVVSDLRSVDWTRDGDALSQAIKELTDAGVKVHLVDVANPARPQDKSRPLGFSDNVGIIELKPRTRVAAKDQPVDFEIRVRNFGNTDLMDVGVQFFKHGQGNVIATIKFPTLPANQERTLLFQATFSQTATKEDPLARFNIVSAVLNKTGVDALAADDVRHAVVEVRDQLSVLVIASAEDNPNDKNGDSFYLRKRFQEGFEKVNWVVGKKENLEREDLRQYSTIFLLNVDSLTEAQSTAIDRYVREGGGVGVFLGPKVVPDAYNKLLYADGKGFFPVPLPAKPTDAPTDEDKLKRALSFTKRVLLRDAAAKTHPALTGIYTNEQGIAVKDTDVERFFYFAGIDQHWPVARLGKWREDRSVQELYCLPNEQPVHTFEESAKKVGDLVKVKYGEPKFEKYRAVVDDLLGKIKAVTGVGDQPTTELARLMDKLLADQVSEGDAGEALLREFWGQTEMAEAKSFAQYVRDSAKFGDPLYFAKRFGNGRVAVMTTTVGAPWTDWPALGGAAGWVAVVTEMQKYLSGGGAEENRTVGTPMTASYETGRYKPAVNWVHVSVDTANPDKSSNKAPVVRDPPVGKDPNVAPLENSDGALALNLTDTKRPGVYMFTLKWQKKDGDAANAPAEKPEYMAAVFNIDSVREGDLQRVKGSDLADQAKGAEVHAADDTGWLDSLKQKQTDLSSGRWIYLVILLVLLAEQAMAVRLSYHTRPEDLEAFAPSAAAAFSHGAPPVTTEGDQMIATAEVRV